MFENKYPYTDFEKLNLDWFLTEFVKLKNELTTLQQTVASLDTVTANPTLSGTEPLLTGIEIGDDKFRAPADVSANPTLSGTEPLLAGLQINDDKYKVPEETKILTSGVHPASPDFKGLQIGNGTVYKVPQILANQLVLPGMPRLESIVISNQTYWILPAVSSIDEGKFLRVDASGEWVAETVPAAEGEDF